MRFLLAAALALLPMPTLVPALAQEQAQAPAADPVTSILVEAGPGTRWGLVVEDAEGREIMAINPQGRFVPASNTKLFTTAAALWAEAQRRSARLDQSGASVRLEGSDVVLSGRGDARLSSADDCTGNCIGMLADAVASRTHSVRDVIGDATLFPDQRWSPGMSWNNIPTGSGTAVAALSLDDNEIAATVAPGRIGTPPSVALSAYYTVENHARTVAGPGQSLAYDRMPGSRVLVISGTIGLDNGPVSWRLGVDDPAHHAAWRLAELLKRQGVDVQGEIRVRYRPLLPEDDPARRSGAPAARPPQPAVLAALTPAHLGEAIMTINKQSQNLHAELLLRRLGLALGTGSIADGQAVVAAMLAEAGVPRQDVNLSDGSGMSTYNRVTPRAIVRLLQWSRNQLWGEQLRASLPVGGVDGTLRRRFAGTALEGKIFAKTGTLNSTNALAGWFVAASGQTLTFAIYANDVPEEVRATAIMDRALVALAAAN